MSNENSEIKNEVPTEKTDSMKLENGVPAGDTGLSTSSKAVNPEPATSNTTPTEQITTKPETASATPSNDAPKTTSFNETSTSSVAPTPGNFKAAFKAFSKFGDTKSDGKHITLSQSDKWMKQAKVIDGKKITTTDTGIHFKKLKSLKVTFEEYQKFLEDLAKTKKIEVNEIRSKLADCGQPGLHGVQAGKAAATVERLTDVTRYTGSHKQRFDETGKGKGIAGRKDIPDKSGYVAGYNNKNTYDKTH